MLNKFFSLFSHDIGIDLGTANTLIWVKGKGIVIREPSVVALHKKSKKMVAIGTEAKKMMGKTPASIITVRPLRGGVIADFDATTAMISYYIQNVHEVGNIIPVAWSRPRVVIGIPSVVTEVERRAVWEAALSAGAREAFLIEEPMAAAVGEGISVFMPTGAMVVDIGGGTTEIAIICLGGIVISKSLKIAGDEMDSAIIHYIRLRHGLLIGEKTAEDLKMKIGSAYQTKLKTKNEKLKTEDGEKEQNHDGQTKRQDKMAVIRGRDIETGLPKSLRITEAEVREALSSIVSQIIDGIGDVLEEAPPELTGDILEHGILLTGGGSLLPGLDQLIVERTHIPVLRSEDSLTSVVRGTGKVLENEDLLQRVKVIGGLK
ncbi:MAG: rod shape-determining protein [Candidatus Levybacteria bacterium CG_4_9_14_3_um_filter_35_16]|nr:MAG: rod shape-determining protein [Candidatus Levybacteria bacterium CG22_combo_CG10-13_8_21_14_all_35_11]PIY94281.1 MAG: rod shape-determining protein [Candidatus Levybacteria bacterium CG_4_10_14_0_8_um_filter_35_23]PJA91505.1 MAG: rod shape-determining protein [Candidatus Levybacteria bacterium CG_4_9_14_3_um_filter_35_16]PJC54132.1 MAG: rod shape-determining protein [Candidatus Levybacteria bacterium CG_4_9_14_0_2_um_filter_35_21]